MLNTTKYTRLSAALFALFLAGATTDPAHAAESVASIVEQEIEYTPDTQVVHAEQPIRISNADPFDHKSRVTEQKANGVLGSIVLHDHLDKPGASYLFTIRQPGNYEIRCLLHDGMTATIKVIP